MRVKKITANYSLVLLFFVFAFGLYQAKQQNKKPFDQYNQTEIQKSQKTELKTPNYSNIKVTRLTPNSSTGF